MRFVAIVALAGLGLVRTASATEHLWEMTELFSDASGRFQFIEMTNVGASFQNNQSRAFFHSTTNDSFFVLPNDLPFNTSLRSFVAMTQPAADLLAVQNPGAPAPDYILPENFFDTTADLVSYGLGTPADFSFFNPLEAAHQEFDANDPGADTLPIDGVLSLQYEIDALPHNGTVAINTPRNFALTPPDPFFGSPGAPSFSITVVPEPASALLAAIGLAGLITRRR